VLTPYIDSPETAPTVRREESARGLSFFPVPQAVQGCKGKHQKESYTMAKHLFLYIGFTQRGRSCTMFKASTTAKAPQITLPERIHILKTVQN
jgi:hypothetical protein